ncbi:MAG: hypothetical protein ACHQRJ_20395 [Alphaproteobacteria bacterium]
MSPRINPRQPFPGNCVGFTVVNDRGEPAFSIVYPGVELHDTGLADFKRSIKGAELIKMA